MSNDIIKAYESKLAALRKKSAHVEPRSPEEMQLAFEIDRVRRSRNKAVKAHIKYLQEKENDQVVARLSPTLDSRAQGRTQDSDVSS